LEKLLLPYCRQSLVVGVGSYWLLRDLQGKNREPTSGLEPLYCSVRVIHHALQGVAGVCKRRISKGVSFLRVAARCTVLRSRWCQSGVK
jgi:hypothetical protein